MENKNVKTEKPNVAGAVKEAVKNSNVDPNLTMVSKNLGSEDLISRTQTVMAGIQNGTINPADLNIPSNTERDNLATSVMPSLITKDEQGNLLPNYDVILKAFYVEDRSLDMTEFIESYKGQPYGRTMPFYTDSIAKSKDNNINDANVAIPTNFITRGKRAVKLFMDNLTGTEQTQLNSREFEGEILPFDAKAEDLKQHTRSRKLNNNAYIISRMLEGATPLATSAIPLPTDGSVEDLIASGDAIRNVLGNTVADFKEFMGKFRPGGFGSDELVIHMSPRFHLALVTSLANKPSGDKAYVDATNINLATGNSSESNDFVGSYYGVKMYTNNMLVSGNKIYADDADGNEVLEYENTDNIELLIWPKAYVKFIENTPQILSSPITVNGIPRPHLIGQTTEWSRGLVVIEPLVVGYLTADRGDGSTPSELPEATISNLTTTEATGAGTTDGSVTFDVNIANFVDSGTATLEGQSVTPLTLSDGDNTGLTFTALGAGSYTLKILDGSDEVASQAFAITEATTKTAKKVVYPSKKGTILKISYANKGKFFKRRLEISKENDKKIALKNKEANARSKK